MATKYHRAEKMYVKDKTKLVVTFETGMVKVFDLCYFDEEVSEDDGS